MSENGGREAGAIDETSGQFWNLVDHHARERRVAIDRPAGSRHPRFPTILCPVDYSCLEGSGAVAGDGVDCCHGSLADSFVTGAVVTGDVVKADSEVNWRVGCTRDEAQAAILLVRKRDAY